MKHLKTAFAMLTFTLISNAIVAQETTPSPEEQKVEMAKQFKIAKEKLSLTPDQEIKFKEISKKYASKGKIIKDGEGDKKAKHKLLLELKSQRNAEMKTILSEAQFKTYLQLKDERRERMKNKMKDQNEE